MQPAYFTRPPSTEHAPGFAKYIALPPEGDLPAFLTAQLHDLQKLLANISDQDALTLHAPYTWTIKQVLGHITDCERVFGYRLLRLARQDATPLPSFDENAWMQHATFNQSPIAALLEEFTHLRRSHLALIRHIPADAWLFAGTVSNHPMTTRAMLYALAGHAQHHLHILHQRLDR